MRCGWPLLAAMLTLAPVASGENPPSSEAEELFLAGRRHLKAGDYERACPAFARSQQLESSRGTRLNLALCLELQDQPAEAYRQYQQLLLEARTAQDNERARIAQTRLAELQARVVFVTLAPELRDGTSEWTLDGAPIEARLLAPLAVAPISHQLCQQRAAMEPECYAIPQLETGAAFVIEPPSESTDPPHGEPPRVVARHHDAPVLDPSSAPGEENDKTSRLLAGSLAASGVGLAGFSAMTYFGLRAGRAWDRRESLCSDTCEPAAQEQGDDARRWARTSNVSLAIGAVGTIAAGTLFTAYQVRRTRTRRQAIRLSPQGSPHGAGVELRVPLR